MISVLSGAAVVSQTQVAVRVLGDLRRLPSEVQKAAAEVELATMQHKKAVLNVCFAYTGRNDMLQAMHAVQVRTCCRRWIP